MVSTWRHIAEAIGKKHLHLRSKDLGMVDGDDEDAEDDPFSLQFGHSVSVGTRMYGRESYLGDILSWENINASRVVSQKFQRFLHVDKDTLSTTTALRVCPSTTQTAVRPAKTLSFRAS